MKIGVSPRALNYLRDRTEDLMQDECVIFEPGQVRVTYDPVTRRATTTPATEVYRGPCRLWEVPAGGKFALGEVEYVTSQMWLSLPYNAPVPEPEHQVQMTKCSDPSMVGRHIKITSVVRGGGLRASRRMQVEFVERKDQ